MPELAYESDELDLTEAERASARNDIRMGFESSEADLLNTIGRRGQLDGVMEAALGLPLDGYRRVEEAFKAAPPADNAPTKTWRRK